MELSRTKIIATVGPSCATLEMIQNMVAKGVNCFRVNLSHGSVQDKESYFKLIQSITLPTGSRPAILADIAGPKIRVTDLNDPVELQKNDVVMISNEDVGENVIPGVGRVIYIQAPDETYSTNVVVKVIAFLYY